MARKRTGLPVDGWLAIDKPLGVTSARAVAAVRRATGATKVGHGGTLDPLASGVLPIALGEATKTVQYVMDGSKTYRWQVRWGEQRTTDDAEGDIVATCDRRPTAAEIEAALGAFIGDILQIPPAYSAIKVEGERAYDLARSGEAPDLAPRRVRIHAFTLLGTPDADHADFETVAGKGTYIRALARDLSQALGTKGYVSRLRRTACGPFREENAISLETIEEVGQGPALRSHLLPVETALDDIPALALTEAEARRLRNGQALPLLQVAARNPLAKIAQDTVVRAMDGRRVVALARIAGGEIRPMRVIHSKTDDQQE
ncbi:MAG: tRNA pseudouridine(55) synthase TruB [Magnetospirillum sp.]|nr:tRNA pseudouridine(55) synthase TruB [Magnetospirillum sp.]